MRAIMKHTFLLFFLLLYAATVVAQERPSWVDGYFNDLAYSYIKTASASGFSEEEALEKALAQVIEARSQESGIRMKVSDLRVVGRATQGVRLINLEKRNDEIASVCKVQSETAEETAEGSGASGEVEVKEDGNN